DGYSVVLADGKEVLRQRMRGGEAPKEIRVSTAGADQVTLVVEPGEDLDLADHADWCDVRFVQSETKEDTKGK
ncbi:MAG: NPCBM/NEW2 domain-containing protein, partial [Pirellulales bacterium]